MGSFLLRVVVNGVALWVAALIVPGISFGAQSGLVAEVISIAAVGLIFGLLNAVVRPILFLLSLPLLILTLGLFTFVLNAVMLSLTSWVAEIVGLSFTVDHFFWDAILGALVISIVSLILSLLYQEERAPARY
ncbi:MAG: phage holin family protein [Ornithinimicrobium sp.]